VISFDWTLGDPSQMRLAAMGVALVKYLSSVSWMSRDVYFVFTDRLLPYSAGVRAFLEEYHHNPFSNFIRRGVIRMATVIESDEGLIDGVLLDVDSVDGSLPNQDLVNVYSTEARQAGIPVKNRGVWNTIFRMATNAGAASAHTPFLQQSIPCFTIRALSKKLDSLQAGTLSRLASSVEGLIRSQSKTLQSLHHSFNFYFFTKDGRHSSIGTYFYPMVLVGTPLYAMIVQNEVSYSARNLFIGMSSLLSLTLFGSLHSYLLAMASSNSVAGVHYTPDCSAYDVTMEDVYRTKAAIWCIDACIGYTIGVAILLLLGKYVFETTSKNCGRGDAPPASFANCLRVSAQACVFLFIAPMMLYNWSLCIPFTVLSLPILMFIKPLSFRKRKDAVVSFTVMAYVGLVLIFFSPFGSSLPGVAHSIVSHSNFVVDKYLLVPFTHIAKSSPSSNSFFQKNELLRFLSSQKPNEVFASASATPTNTWNNSSEVNAITSDFIRRVGCLLPTGATSLVVEPIIRFIVQHSNPVVTRELYKIGRNSFCVGDTLFASLWTFIPSLLFSSILIFFM